MRKRDILAAIGMALPAASAVLVPVIIKIVEVWA